MEGKGERRKTAAREGGCPRTGTLLSWPVSHASISRWTDSPCTVSAGFLTRVLCCVEDVGPVASMWEGKASRHLLIVYVELSNVLLDPGLHGFQFLQVRISAYGGIVVCQEHLTAGSFSGLQLQGKHSIANGEEHRLSNLLAPARHSRLREFTIRNSMLGWCL